MMDLRNKTHNNFYAKLSETDENLVPFSDVEKMIDNMPYDIDGQELWPHIFIKKITLKYYNKSKRRLKKA